MKQPKANGITTVIGAVVNIVVHLALIGAVGLYAAAISTLVSNVTIVVLRKILLAREDIKVKIGREAYICTAVYLYVAICAYLYTSLPLWLNIANVVLSGVVFMVVNRGYVVKIKQKVLGRR